MSKDYLKEHWESRGAEFRESHWASWGDSWAIDLEINTIDCYIKGGGKVLDVGCSNGYSTFKLFERNPLCHFTGIDFASNMISVAKESIKKNVTQKHIDNIHFEVGDIRDLKFPNDFFDTTYTTRVLINLPTWEEQKKGIAECIRVTKPGGTIIFSEAFWEQLMLLNAMRHLNGLPLLVEHDFNRYLKHSSLKVYFHQLNLKYEVNDFSSIYYLGTRFLRELVDKPGQYADFKSPFNKIFHEMETQFSGGGFGIQQAIIITK